MAAISPGSEWCDDIATAATEDCAHAAGFSVRKAEKPFTQNHGPTYRAIYDLDPMGQSYFIQNAGQSGNPLSSNYRDFAEMWRDGRYMPMPMNRSQIEASSAYTLRLLPR